jgi:hypothetical protein
VSGSSSPGGPLSFDADAFESRLAWIFGSTRSGSTWLLRLLCHPLTLTREGDLGFRLPSEAQRDPPIDALPVNEFLLGHHLAPVTGDPIKTEDGQYLPAAMNFFWRPATDYVMSKDFEDVWRPELRRFALVRLHAVLERAAARFPVRRDAAVVIKDVGTSHAAHVTMSLLPRSRLLFMVRDGRDVIDSLIHAAQPGSWFARMVKPLVSSDADRLDLVRQKAIQWACWTDSCQRAWAAHPPELRRMVRYEQLLADPVGELSGLGQWMVSSATAPESRKRYASTRSAPRNRPVPASSRERRHPGSGGGTSPQRRSGSSKRSWATGSSPSGTRCSPQMRSVRTGSRGIG